MGLYNQLFGVNKDFPCLLGMIGFTMTDFERFRDAYICDSGENIIVYTRLGGGNREDYQHVYDKVRASEYYLEDYDDGLDETYAYIKFRVPDKYKETTKMMFKEEPTSIGDKFEKEFKEMEDPNSEAYKRAEQMAKALKNIIENSNGGIIMM
jgi:hypothetical protein